LHLNKKLSKGKVSVVVGTQKEDLDHLVTSRDISRNDKDIESKIDKILNELKDELRAELGLTEEKNHQVKASQQKGLDHFIYESLSKST
tara:strand:+ start:572 stop:838 length:267 start_codon:yes stop_codon:yes gene_type:complete